MTKEEFKAASFDQQEEFLASGQRLSSASSEEQSKEQVATYPECSSVHSLHSASTNTEDNGLTTQPLQPAPFSSNNIDGLLVQDPVELLFLLDDDIASGRVLLHPWQIQIMLDFADTRWSQDRPYQGVVRACNGSGKDKYIIASCAVWLCMRYKNTTFPITSSSGAQLDNQTCRYIKALCEAINSKFGVLWKLNYRDYSIKFGDGLESHIYCYATDEPKKAEGYHPTRFGDRMGIAASEDKTIPDEINVAINKCTGYTHRLHVSTPGLPIGHFNDLCNLAVKRKDIKSLDELQPTDWVEYHITAYDCSHISKAYIQQMKRDLPGGENGSAFKSQVLAEFGSTEEESVIPFSHVYRLLKNTSIPRFEEDFNTGGLDLARGGDETSLTVRNGNKRLTTIPFKFDNTEDTVEFLTEKFKEWNLVSKKALIFADAGGLGSPIIDRLRGLGWTNVRYVLNQGSALNKRIYRNRGAEMWFEFAKLVEKQEVILDLEITDLLIKQLISRRYKRVSGEQHQLESKMKAKSEGRLSPDRADSLTLCFSNYKSQLADDYGTDSPFKVEDTEEEQQVSGDFVLKNWANQSFKKWTPNGGQKDFSTLESEIADYNKQLVNT